MAFNPFHSFRRYQKTIFAGLAIVCMFIFVLSSGMGGGDIFNQMTDWVSGRSVSSKAQASLFGKDLDGATIANTQRRRKLASDFMFAAKFTATQVLKQRLFAQFNQMEPNLQRVFADYLNLPQTVRSDREFIFRLMQIRNQLLNQMIPELESGTAGNKKDQIATAQNLATLIQDQLSQIDRPAKEGFFGGDVQSLDDTLNFLIWKNKADELGIIYDKKDVNQAVKYEQLNQDLPADAQKEIDNRFRQDYRGTYNPELLFDALTDEFRVRAAQAALAGVGTHTRTVPPIMATPDEKFDWYKDSRTQVRVGLIEVPVANFIAKVTESPTEAQLKELYSKHKNDEQDPRLERPGFKEPRKVNVEWLAARDDSAHYRKTAEQIDPVLRAMRHFGAAGVDWTPVHTALALSPTVSDSALASQYESYLTADAKWTNPFGFGSRSLIHDSSVLRPENIAILTGACVGGEMTGAGLFSGQVALYSRVIVREVRDRAKIGVSAILAGALDPAPLGIDALPMLLTPPATTESAVRSILAERERDRMASALRDADLTNFQAELAKLANDSDANKVRTYINEFVQSRQLERGGMAEARDRHALPNDPGVAPLRNPANLTRDPVGEQFAMQLADGPFPRMNNLQPPSKPKNFDAQPFFGNDVIYLAWRSEDREPKIVPFEQAKPKVEAAWKLAKARELAKAEADKFANEAKGLDAQKLRDLAARTSSRLLIELPAMAKWNSKPSMTGGAADYTPPEIPRDRVPYPGDMAEKLVDMRTKAPGETTVVADQPKSAYYVASLIGKDVPTVSEFTMAYRNSMGPSMIRDQLLNRFTLERQEDFRRGMLEQLRKEAKLKKYDSKSNNDNEEAA